MAKHPDWSRTEPSYFIQRYWTSQATPSNPGAGFWTDTRSDSSPTIVDSGTRTYQVTPGWANPGRSTLVKPRSYTAAYRRSGAHYLQRNTEYRTINTSGGPVRYLYSDSTTEAFNLFPLSFRQGEYDPASVLRKATEKLLENLKDQKVNVAQAFAEREETAKTVYQTAQTIARVLSSLHSGNYKKAAQALGIKPPKRGMRKFNSSYANDAANAIGNGWLSLQYGWKPLLQDVYGAAETLAQASLGPENRNSIYASSFGQNRKPLTLSQSVTNSTSGFSGYDVTSYKCKGFYLARVGVRYTRSSAPVSSLSKLGILNPVALAWELVPYSFVVDWFLPIGNWLNGLDATAGLSFESGYQTTLLKYESTTMRVQDIQRITPDVTTTFGNLIQEFSSRTDMQRITLSSFPSMPAPRFKNPLSFSHVASAMALLKQFKR